MIMKKPLFTAPMRLQRMMLQLQRHDLSLVYKKGFQLFIADTLSRAHTPAIFAREIADSE